MPFDSAHSLEAGGFYNPFVKNVEIAAAAFNSGHPYLLFHKEQIARIKKASKKNKKVLTRLYEAFNPKKGCQVEWETRKKIKLQARRLINTSFCAVIGEGSKAEGALQITRDILREFISVPSWRQRPVIRSFLDCAEIAVAVALAYDWLYDKFSETERQEIEQSLLKHVLEPAIAAYDDPTVRWPKRRGNCALVSNSGILLASLAMLERYPSLSRLLLEKSLTSSHNIFETFEPDGAWPEGLSYWSLAIRHAGLMVAALESTFGTSFGLADQPGFAQTGDFALHAVGPFGAAFNFGDSEREFDVSPLAWLAHRFQRPVDGWLVRNYDGCHLPLTMIWQNQPAAEPGALNLPTGKVFQGNQLACFRNTWSSNEGARPVYLAIKGGNISTGRSASLVSPEDVMLHAQADAGSFIVDGARRRWVIDLGSDDYDLPGYFDHGPDHLSGPRWRYYRAHAAGHNTLVIDGRNQIPNACTMIIGSGVEAGRKWVVFDLSAAYGKPANSICRGAALIGRRVLIQDEIGPDIAGHIVWAMHTSADPDFVAGSVARFRLGGDRFVARILEPSTARFELTLPPAPSSFRIADDGHLHGRPLADRGGLVSELPRRDDENGGRAGGAPIRRLEISWPKGARRVSVLLLPDCEDDDQVLPVTPLAYWLAHSPFLPSGHRSLSTMPSGSALLSEGLQPIGRRGKPAFSGTNSPVRIEHA